MARSSVKVLGGEELLIRLENLKSSVLSGVVKGVNVSTAIVNQRAKSRCVTRKAPIGGTLKASIKVHPAKIDGNSVTGKVFTATEYAIYVECGTGRRGSGSYPYKTKFPLSYRMDWGGKEARPFLMPALLESKVEIQRIVSAYVMQAATKGK